MADVKTETTKEETASKYTKTRLMASEAYKKYRDLLSVLLEEDRSYTRKEVDKLINEYLKRGIK